MQGDTEMNKSTPKLLRLIILCLVINLAAAGSCLANMELVIYAANPSEEAASYKKAFTAAHPEIKTKWIVDSTGVISAKLLAEKANPVADVVWTLSVGSLITLDKEGILLPYSPVGLEELDTKYIDPQPKPKWVGRAAWASSISMNTVEAKKYNFPAPTTWQDLAKPEYKGHVVMPNPASSGTGYLVVYAWIQMWGEEKAWKYMDALHENISVYTHSGSKPAKMAGAGETVFGISYPGRAASIKGKGAPIDIIIPTEGIGWDMEAGAIIKGAKNLKAAKILMDWNASKDCAKLAATWNAGVARPEMIKPVKFFPQEVYDRMIPVDFKRMSENKSRILAKWLERYDAKSVPK